MMWVLRPVRWQESWERQRQEMELQLREAHGEAHRRGVPVG